MQKKDTVLSIKTLPALKQKLQFIASKEHRSMSMQIELFLQEKIAEWEKTHGRIPESKLPR
jgi:predicted transcriptional regulator